jgi:hypothetical protein
MDLLNGFLIDCFMQNSTFTPSTKDRFRLNY